MPEFFDKFIYPIVIGTIIGFLLTWALEAIRLNYKRKKILLGLHRQIEAIPRFGLHNKTSTEQSEPEHVVPMPYPTIPFETAIFSENGISVREETLQAAIDYLIKAYELNALVNVLQDSFSTTDGSKTNDSRLQVKRNLLEQVTDVTNNYSMHNRTEKLKIQIKIEQRRLFIIY
ncbi:MAG: hypothetical protein Q8L68_07005 [Methylococcales bacterium]|nr:hypothetical protein [Methylococcales bacterium]